MPAFTQSQYTAITAAYAQGVTRVRYGDKEVEYRSLSEMEKIIARMEIELGVKRPVTKKYIQHSKGLR